MRTSKYLMGMSTAVMALGSASAAAPASQPAGFVRAFSVYVDKLRAGPYAPPGFVLVVFDRDRPVFARAYGVANLATGKPMTLDTLVYNASLTKAYTGLLASSLQEDHTLPLATSLKDVWPQAMLPAGLDPSKVTALRLLSHSSAIFDGGLQFQTNVAGIASPSSVPNHLARYAEPTMAFRYSNFGPSVYAAMATARTGLSWRELLERRVLAPLALRDTKTSVETAPAGRFAHCHTYAGGKWRVVPLKPTAVLNAAGGIYASGRDTMRFMQAAATDGRSAGGRIPAHVWRRTWARASDQQVDFGGMSRDGYGLGWDLGAYDGQRYVSRSGGYTGCRSFGLFLPDSGFGVALLSAGDMAVNAFNIAIVQQAIDLWNRRADAGSRGRERVARYAGAAKAAAARLQTIDPRIVAPPPLDRRTAIAAPGVYANSRLGKFIVTLTPRGLEAESGALIVDLVPVSAGESLLVQRGEYEPMPVRWIGDPSQPFSAFEWDGDRFDRVAN